MFATRSLKGRFIASLAAVLSLALLLGGFATRRAAERQLLESASATVAAQAAVFDAIVDADAEGLARASTRSSRRSRRATSTPSSRRHGQCSRT